MNAHKVEAAIKLVLSQREKTGRVTLMKHLYFLQEVEEIKLGLNFELYTWGPFDKKVLAANNKLKKQGEIDEEQLEEGKGYKISLVTNSNAPSEMTSAYKKVMANIASKPPKTLEALSTLHKVQCMLPEANKAKVIQTVKTLKPHLPMSGLRTNYNNLQKWGWLPQQPTA